MRIYFLKKRILKILNENPNKWYHGIEIGDKIYHCYLNKITFPDWSHIRKALTQLKKEKKILEDTRCGTFKIERRYCDDRFLYKG